jgi:ribosomal protein S18 acetylase RimI-like enzyme
MSGTLPFLIEPLQASDFSRCAQLTSQSDPWLTLGVDRHQALLALMGSGEGGIVARTAPGEPAVGFIRYAARGFIDRWGYIRTVAVEAEARGQGVGEAMMAYAERDCFEQSPHVFLFCSSFNGSAQRFYEHVGYRRVGTVQGLLVPQYGELLYVKSRGAPS